MFIQVKNITKRFESLSGKAITAIDNLTFSIEDGEFLTVVGPSGSGKSTLLNVIAGIEKPTSGEVKFSDHLNNPRIGLVFQANTIFPWRTVEKNLTYALELQRIDRVKRKQRAVDLCQIVGLDSDTFLRKYPKELSGGEQRRVAIGMALAYDANLLLLDEPTSQLDYRTKSGIQNTIQRLWLKDNFTVVLVTHDLEEAIFLGDRVLILDNGIIKGSLEIKLPRPREDSMRGSEMFNAYRNRIVELHEDHQQ